MRLRGGGASRRNACFVADGVACALSEKDPERPAVVGNSGLTATDTPVCAEWEPILIDRNSLVGGGLHRPPCYCGLAGKGRRRWKRKLERIRLAGGEPPRN